MILVVVFHHLHTLTQLPVDYLKIDGSFVRDIVHDQVDYEMVRSIKDIAGVMGMKTIAEFVENADIKDKLLEIGIDYGQGYFISKPGNAQVISIYCNFRVMSTETCLLERNIIIKVVINRRSCVFSRRC